MQYSCFVSSHINFKGGYKRVDSLTADLIDEILSVFVPVFVSKEVDASSPERYNPSNSEELEDNK